MGKILEFRLPDKAASGNVEYETPVQSAFTPEKLELGVWDEETKERFKVFRRESCDRRMFVYFLKKFN
jgi:hypothetical protein